MSDLQQRIEERGGAHRYRVTIIAEGLGCETFEVPADREGQAQSLAMLLTTLPLRGQFVTYETEVLS